MQLFASGNSKIYNNKVVVLLIILLVYMVVSFIGFRIPIALLFGPFLLFFVSNRKLKPKFYLLHSSLFLIFLLVRIFLQPYAVYMEYRYWFYIPYDGVTIISMLAYMIYVYKQRDKFKLTSFSALYLRQLFFVYIIYIGVSFIFLYTRVFKPGASVSVVIDVMMTLLTMAFIISALYLIGSYRGRKKITVKEPADQRFEQQNRYGLSDLELQSYGQQIEFFFSTSDRFLEMNFNLEVLAKDLQIPKHHLSVCFTHYFNSNFYKLLAKYRIQQAVKLADNLSYHTWESIAHDCGYSSRSTFNKHFKKITGYLPSEFSEVNKLA